MDFRAGMNEVYSPPPGQTPVTNVVLVHGLFGGPWKTWAAKSKDPRDGFMGVEDPVSNASSMDSLPNDKQKPSRHVFWPESLLPSAVKNVKVYSFGYDAEVERFMSSAGLNTVRLAARNVKSPVIPALLGFLLMQHQVHQHGRNLLNELHALRGSQLPTIIVAHSLGGLVVKEALNQAAHSAHQDEKEVVSKTNGIIFLGTPHKGSNAASFGRIAYLLTRIFAFQSANTKLLTALETNSETLDRISTQFFHTLETYKNLRIASFSEEKQIRFGVFGMQVVKPDSAKIGHVRETWGSISEDHRNIAKYISSRDDGFVKVSRKIKEWVDDAQRYMSSTDLKIYKECLKSLDNPVARFRVQEIDPVRHYNKNTFEWLFTDQVPFSRWLCDDSGEFDALFWITGKPGSGKSTLMRFALEDSRTMSLQPSDSKGHPMAYFFHLRGKSLVQKSLRGMLMELMYQVLDSYPRFFALIRPIFLDLKRTRQDWDIHSLSQAILHIPHLPPAATGFRDRITFFIDALDENQNRDDSVTLLRIFDDLIATYRDVRHKPDAPVLKICLASRPWPIFRKWLANDSHVPSFAIHDFTLQDIQQYTTTHIIKAFGERQRAVSQLSTDIASRAKGVFIWVRVVVNNLHQEIIDGTPMESLRKILHQYPTELDEMYELTLKRIPPAYLPESKILFKTMLASRVPFTVLGVYTATKLCRGNPPPEDGPTESLDDVTSWLASRSGGLIDMVGTNGREERCLVSGSDSEATSSQSASNFSARPNPQVEFMHQTAQDFVRNNLRNTRKIAQPQPEVAEGSGELLLALACLDRHPPHLYLRHVAKDIFTYIREVEREEDRGRQPLTALPHWDSYGLHDFPFKIRDLKECSGKARTTSKTISYYLDPQNPLAAMVLGQDKDLYDEEISFCIRPTLVKILHNLYRTSKSERVLMRKPEYAQIVGNVLLFIASVGPRLSNDRLNRRRMFLHILTDFAEPLWARFYSRSINQKSLNWLSYRPVIGFINNLSISRLPTDLIRLFACLEPSTEIDDNTLLAYTECLERFTAQYSPDWIMVEVPITSTHGPDKRESGCQTVGMSPQAFCSRFRKTNLSKWVALFQHLEADPIDVRTRKLGWQQRFVDLAVYDAVNQRPPRRVYTRLANYGDWITRYPGEITGQAIASACFPAAVVGLGRSGIARAFYSSSLARSQVQGIDQEGP